jgi:1,5-anhydro-D-fructose reductase (1,5-anhydro-D-mannitol-forming)
MKTIGFGIIGCGDVTEKKSGPAFQKIEGSRLVSVMRRDPVKLADYARRHGVGKYSTNYLDLLTDPEIDAVYIATPPYMHHFYTLEAARHGKNVYVEKPMATTVRECREMMDACKTHGVKLFVAYYRRGQEKFRRVKAALTSGEIGQIRSFQYTYACPVPAFNKERAWLLSKKEAGGGLLYDIGSHMVDTLQYVLGEVSMAAGLSANISKAYDVSDVTSGFLRFTSGVQGAMQFSFHASENRDEAVIYGSEGSLRFSMMDMEPVVLQKNSREERISFEPLMHVQMPYIQHVVRILQGLEEGDTTGAYGLRTQEILEAFEESRTINYPV